MNDITKPLQSYFRNKMNGNQRFIYCRVSVAATVATDFSTRVAYHPSWHQQSQLFDDQKREQENQCLAPYQLDTSSSMVRALGVASSHFFGVVKPMERCDRRSL